MSSSNRARLKFTRGQMGVVSLVESPGFFWRYNENAASFPINGLKPSGCSVSSGVEAGVLLLTPGLLRFAKNHSYISSNLPWIFSTCPLISVCWLLLPHSRVSLPTRGQRNRTHLPFDDSNGEMKRISMSDQRLFQLCNTPSLLCPRDLHPALLQILPQPSSPRPLAIPGRI